MKNLKYLIIPCLLIVIGLVFIGVLPADAQNYPNLLNYNLNSAPVNGVKIKTNLPFTPTTQMPTIIIEGNNFGTGEPIGLILTYYTSSGGSGDYFHQPQITSFSKHAPP